MDVCSIIKEAEVCAGKISAQYAVSKTFGNTNEALFYDLLRINTYIRTLERNVPQKREIKSKKPLSGTTVDFSSLKKQNNTLILETEGEVICTTVEVSPCLSESEVCRIAEQVKTMCSVCNC